MNRNAGSNTSRPRSTRPRRHVGASLAEATIYGYGELAASGRMAMLPTGAVADMIVTDPAHRRRGLARAVMTALATAAAPRSPTAYLAASPQGHPLYTTLGWTTLTPLLVARTSVASGG
ncbi:GNAT family N-acetyltransferase [Kribbella sp. NPDC048915]|uniref:GNAT family N-acetyltransferase n=1 Tax=Kribbella sp. NPDC048915 TaxID=3155148 RepID=UPI0034051671